MTTGLLPRLGSLHTPPSPSLGKGPRQLGHRLTTALDDSVAVVTAGLNLVSTFIWKTSGRLYSGSSRSADGYPATGVCNGAGTFDDPDALAVGGGCCAAPAAASPQFMTLGHPPGT